MNERIERMIRPAELAKDEPLVWSPGRGTDVWDLFCACIEGDLAAVRRLIAKDPALVRCRHGYLRPLYFAVRENQLAVAAFLLESGATRWDQGLEEMARDRGYAEMEKLVALGEDTAVALAIRERDAGRVRGLLDGAPELLHARDSRGNQPIHWATMTRQPDLIDDLLARGADIEAERWDDARPIQLTSGDYHYRGWRDVPADWPVSSAEVLAHLRARGAYVDIRTACGLGELDRVRELLDSDPALANRASKYVTYYMGSGTPLRNAAGAGSVEIVKLLLERGADPNQPEEGIAPRGHALYTAAADGHHEIARLLLEHGANPNAPVESSADALSRAISNEDEEMIELLCRYGAAREVHLLGYYGDVRTAAAVFAVNPALANDAEALTNAAGEDQEAFVRLLLRYQPDLPARASFPGWSVGAKSRELNELLFAHGLNASAPDWLRVTPLHHLARKGDVDKALQFIEHGADLDARDEDIRSTPLGWAARDGQLEMVRVLLERGARANLPDDAPDLLWATPLAWARRRGHREIVELLTSAAS